MTDVERIARHYGFAEQSRQIIEEMAELTIAISKIHRDWNDENYENLVEEMADVQVMLDQMMYLTGSKYDVKNIMNRKIKRQLERIKE